MKDQKISIGNNQKDKIETKQLKIAKNIFAYNNTFLPLSSISRVSVVKETEEQYSTQAIVALVVGVIFLFVGGLFSFIGILVAAASALILYKTYKFNQDIGEYLVIELNSGSRLYFYEKNHNFLIEVMNVMINCINSNSEKEYLISMDTYNIETCQFGSGNYMVTQTKGEE